MTTPQISVILPAYDVEKYLGKAVQSILDQTFTDFELIIINDGSVDGTLSVAKSFTDPRIRVIDNGKNVGVSAARNVGIENSNGEFIAVQDGDDYSHPTRLQMQIDFMQANLNIALVGSGGDFINSDGDLIRQVQMPISPTYESLKNRNEIISASVMIRKSILDDVGFYNPHFKAAEDYELWLRISKKYPIANLPDIHYQILVHSQSATGSDPSGLVGWHMLALAVANKLVTDKQVQEYYDNGIETFVNEMPAELNREYLTLLAAGYKNAKHYQLAKKAFIRYGKNYGWNFKTIRNVIKCHMLSKPSK